MAPLVFPDARSSGEAEDTAFCQVAIMLLLLCACLLGIYMLVYCSQAASWTDYFCLLKSLVLPGAGSAPCCLFQWVWGQLLGEHPLFKKSLYLSTCISCGFLKII